MMKIEIDNLNKNQEESLIKMFQKWIEISNSGMDRWTSVFIESSPKPIILINDINLNNNDSNNRHQE